MADANYSTPVLSRRVRCYTRTEHTVQLLPQSDEDTGRRDGRRDDCVVYSPL